jgi:hypothetical protein
MQAIGTATMLSVGPESPTVATGDSLWVSTTVMVFNVAANTAALVLSGVRAIRLALMTLITG